MELPLVRSLAPTPGGQLALDDIVGRDAWIAQTWDVLDGTSNSLLLTEPRRIGKTQVLRKLIEHRPPGWKAIHRSFQAINTTRGFAESLLGQLATHAGLGNKAAKALKGFASAAKMSGSYAGMEFQLGAAFRDDPIAALESAINAVAKALGSERLLLACDEVPDMIEAIALNEGPDAARQTLALLRAGREGASTNVRWLITGSVGFHHVLRGLDKDDLLNDLRPIHLGPLDTDWSSWLAESLLLGAGVTEPDPAAVARLAEVSDGFAIIIHLVAAAVRDQQRRQVAPSDIDAILDHAFADLDESNQFTALLSRVDPCYGDAATLAEWVLDRTATAPATRQVLLAEMTDTDDRTLRQVLDWLRLDHYLAIDDTGADRLYHWRYDALRRLWQLRRR